MEFQNEVDKIQLACRLGDIKLLKAALSSSPSSVNETDSKLGWTPVYRAVICGHLDTVRFLLEEGADPNIPNKLGETALHQAADNNQVRIAQLLLSHNADPNLQQSDGDTPLHHAAYKGNYQMASLLLNYNADPNILNSVFGRSPLHYAVEHSTGKLARLMVKHGADPYLKDLAGKSSVDLATSEEVLNSLKEPQKSPKSVSNNSTTNSPCVKPEPLQEIPPIPQISFEKVSLSPHSAKSESKKEESKSFFSATEPEAEKSEINNSYLLRKETFSFGGDQSALHNWLSSHKLEELFECLAASGCDLETIHSITLEGLESLGIYKPGHRKRLIAALKEEKQPSKPTNTLACCAKPVSGNHTLNQLPSLETWLKSISLEHLYGNFAESGYEDLEHMLALMHTNLSIDEWVLEKEVGIAKQGHRHRILSKLKEDCPQVTSFKKPPSLRLELRIESASNATPCRMCTLM